MEFKRNARIRAPLSDVWALVDDIPTVAGCIPGVHDLDMRGEREFDCVVSQRVGSVKSNFALHTVVGDLEPRKRLTLESQGGRTGRSPPASRRTSSSGSPTRA